MALLTLLAGLLVTSPLLWPQDGQERIVAYRLFVATSAGPYESHDWGEQWHPMGKRLPASVRTFVCLGPDAFAGGADGLYQSSDHGWAWSRVESWQGGAVLSITSSSFFAAEPVLFVGTEAGLYRSRDAGVRWERVGAGVLDGAVHAMAWPGPGLFVATTRGLFLSDDGGDTWLELGEELHGVSLLSLTLSRFFGQDPVMFVGTDGRGIYRSRDGGKSFESLKTPSATIYSMFWWGTSLLIGTDAGAFVSMDAGESWEALADVVRGTSVYTIHIPAPDAPSGSDILLGTARGVFKSSDGGLEWRHLTNGLGAVAVQGFGNFPVPIDDPGRQKK